MAADGHEALAPNAKPIAGLVLVRSSAVGGPGALPRKTRPLAWITIADVLVVVDALRSSLQKTIEHAFGNTAEIVRMTFDEADLHLLRRRIVADGGNCGGEDADHFHDDSDLLTPGKSTAEPPVQFR